MDTRRWMRIQEVFADGLEVAPEERAGFVQTACGDDEELRGEVERLLSLDEGSEGFLEHERTPASTETRDPMLGRSLGVWRLERRIGAGGMGTVYLARRVDEEFEMRAALKLIRRGMDTEDVLRRFRNERQVLADLEHPGIARLLDGGAAPDGRPYLVMERVPGERIDRFCDDRNLTVRGRVELFVKVCEAVAYAHARNVVHRDLKPSNVLVSAEGAPKLIDFGIAKVLDTSGSPPTADMTATEQRRLTPDFAAPEQIRGGRIAPATDVYGLGCLLYELLTGRRPYEIVSGMPGELERLVCEERPRPPSAATDGRGMGLASDDAALRRGTTARRLRSQLSGDLDTIVMMALRKEPERRYRTAGELGADLKRWLEERPVLARRDRLGYRASRFARRHRGLVVSSSAAFAALVIGLVSSLWLWREAVEQRGAAEEREYLAEITAANLFLRGNDVPSARARLARAPDGRRAWEWRHLASRLDQSLATLAHENRSTRGVAWSPGGRTLATGDSFGSVTLWDVGTCRAKETIRVGAQGVQALAFDPAGPFLAVLLEEGETVLLDLTAEPACEVWRAGELSYALAFAPDGRRLAIGRADGTIALHDSRSGAVELSFPAHVGHVNCIAFLLDGERLVSGGADGVARMWGPAAAPLRVWKVAGQVPLERLVPRESGILSVSVGADGRIVAAVTAQKLVAWDTESGERLCQVQPNEAHFKQVAFRPGGAELATGSRDSCVRLWNATSGELLTTLLGHRAGLISLAYSPDGETLASAGDGVKLWSADERRILTLSVDPIWWNNLAPSPDGSSFAAPLHRQRDDGEAEWGAQLRDASSGEELWSARLPQGEVRAVAFEPGGSFVAFGADDGGVVLFDAATGASGERRSLGEAVWSLAVAPGGGLLAAGLGDGRVLLWDPATPGTLLDVAEDERPITALAFDSPGERLATGGRDGIVQVRRVPSGEVLLRVETNAVRVLDLAFVPGGHELVAACEDHRVRVIDVLRGEVRLAMEGHEERVRTVAVHPSEPRVASGDWQGVVKLWDLRTGRETLSLRGHETPISRVVFLGDGSRLLTLSNDGLVRVWEAPLHASLGE